MNARRTPFIPLFRPTQQVRKSLTRYAIQREQQTDRHYYALIRFVALYLNTVYERLDSEGATPWQFAKNLNLIDARNEAAAKSGLLDLFPTDDSVSESVSEANAIALRQAYDYAYLTMVRLNSGVLP